MGKPVSEESRRLFPISRVDRLVQLFRNEFILKGESAGGGEPNIALASILLGAVEHSLTATPAAVAVTAAKTGSGHSSSLHQQSPQPKFTLGTSQNEFPPLEYDIVIALYDKFKSNMKTMVNLTLLRHDQASGKGTSRELVKNISDIIWNSLSRSYMSDKPHLQSLFTYLTGNKLDCFGLALGVVAGCQVLGLSDVHLALSEDHGWVVFGPNGEFNAEVTWHGKGNEDKRGQPIDIPLENTYSWLYLKGHPAICNRNMEIAAIISAINPSISGSYDSTEMGIIQQKLLWALYDAGHLARYPMAIGNLADLEEISATPGRKSCVDLFKEAILADKMHYNNMHVYPYTYYAGYLYRQEQFRETLKCWADAAQVISNYRHSKLDEEIYKEFLEISKEQLTSMMKQCSTGINAHSLTRDPSAFAQLLRFFDGICIWEESSTTPVLHIVWAKCWIGAIGKFEFTARNRVRILTSDEAFSKDCDHASEVGVDLNGNSKDSSPGFTVILKSFKMKGVKDLLLREKLNPAALTLQLTAQPTLVTPGSGKGLEGDTVIRIGERNRKIKSRDEPLISEEAASSKAKRAKK